MSFVPTTSRLGERCETSTECRPCGSICVFDGLSARNRPNVTRKTCSRLAWYGSLMFSNISFQLAGTTWRW